jgi:hypothetical protein
MRPAKPCPECGIRTIKVGVFDDEDHPKRKPMAYTRDYNPTWQRCCEHVVHAVDGAEAKKKAIEEHLINCRSGPAYYLGRKWKEDKED